LTRSLRVLHLEDNAHDAQMIHDRLAVGGLSCDILVAGGKDPFEAALAAEPFDLIISDFNLPGYDGVAALKQVQAVQPHVPVILVSGTVNDEQAVRCLHLGATDYVLKERLGRLVPAVERAIQEAEASRARRHVELALAQSESRKAAILDSVLDCIVTMDTNGIVLEFNTAAVQTFGYSKTDAIGRPLADLIVPAAFRARHNAGLARYVATGSGTMIGRLLEVSAVRADGSDIPVELTITAIRSGDDSIFIGVLRDITARKDADDTRARLAAIVDSSEDAILSLALDDTFLTWNAGAERLYGYTASEMIGQSRSLIVPATKNDDVLSGLRDAARGAASGPFETQRVRKDGSLVDVSLVVSPMMDASGQVNSISMIARNITGRKTAETELRRLSDEVQLQRLQEHDRAQTRAEELERYASALRVSEERMNYALGAARMGVWELDLATQRLTWSKTMAALYGLTPEQTPTTSGAFMALIHPDDRRATELALATAVAKGSDFDTEFRVLWPDGSVHWNAGHARVLRDDQGEPVSVHGVGEDISERKSLEDQFRQAQKMDAIGRLAGGVAHDFNNLLTAILGYSNFVIETLSPEDERRADMEEILKAGERAAGLTRQLLAFSRKQMLQPTLVNLNAMVTGIRPMLSRLIGEHVDLVPILVDAPCLVRADSGQLEQVLMNLVVNARDAMPSGGRVTIETANVELDESFAQDVVVQPGAYVMLAVSDNGSGMDEATRLRLFEPFFTTKEPGKGTGLGLATVFGIVKQSGGYIWVFSEPGQGATFKVYLPCASGHETAQTHAVGDAPIAAPKETVLVVEDQDAVRLLTCRILKVAGYRVFDAPNPEQAEVLFDADISRFDLLVTDVVMPGSSGPQLFQRLVARRPDLRVLYLSGYTDDTIVHQGDLNPGIDLLQKPFTAAALNRRVREVLAR
jgi:two-component system cell cycle sensor histidine kinase/response regulator CckA